MNIWIFNHYAVGPGSSGITRHYDLAKELIKKDIRVTIFASSFNYHTRKEEKEYKKNEWFKIESIDGIRFIWIKTSEYQTNNYKRVLNMLSYSYRVYRLSKRLGDHPTHIVGSLMHPFAAISAAFVAKKQKSFFIFEERDLWPQSMIDLGKVSEKSLKVRLLRSMEKWLIDSADRIMLLFEKAKDYMYQRGVDKEKIMVITNGVDASRFSNDKKEELPEEINRYLSALKNKLVAVYTGAHGMANNLDEVLNAAKYLQEKNNNDIHFLLVGDGVHKRSLLNRKEKEQIENVTFMDPINKKYIPQLLQSVDVGLLPLHNSPVFNWGISPNKMYDYMAASLPVVLMCDIEDEILENNKCGVVVRKNQALELSELLINWSKNSNVVKTMGENGYQFVHKHCTWQVLSEKFLLELKKLTKK